MPRQAGRRSPLDPHRAATHGRHAGAVRLARPEVVAIGKVTDGRRVKPYMRGGFQVDIRLCCRTGCPFENEKCSGRHPSRPRSDGGRNGSEICCSTASPNPRRSCPRSQSSRFMDGYARANRQKHSGIAANETVLSRHLIPTLGGRAAIEAPPEGERGEARQHRAGGAERAAEDGRVVGPDRAASVLDPVQAARPELLHEQDDTGGSQQERDEDRTRSYVNPEM